VYLTTHDQQGFYERLGYRMCDPIVIYGGKPNFLTNNNNNGVLQEDKESYKKSCILTQDLGNLNLKPSEKIDDLPDSQVPNLTHPPPPPPPLPPIQIKKASNIGQSWRRFSNGSIPQLFHNLNSALMAQPTTNKRDIVVLTNDSSQVKVTMKKDIA